MLNGKSRELYRCKNTTFSLYEWQATLIKRLPDRAQWIRDLITEGLKQELPQDAAVFIAASELQNSE